MGRFPSMGYADTSVRSLCASPRRSNEQEAEPLRKTALGMVVTTGVAIGGLAAPAAADPPECNWGQATADAIANGFDQGGHASDPTGDGHGPGTVDEPRVGLANVVERGNLEATCTFIVG